MRNDARKTEGARCPEKRRRQHHHDKGHSITKAAIQAIYRPGALSICSTPSTSWVPVPVENHEPLTRIENMSVANGCPVPDLYPVVTGTAGQYWKCGRLCRSFFPLPLLTGNPDHTGLSPLDADSYRFRSQFRMPGGESYRS